MMMRWSGTRSGQARPLPLKVRSTAAPWATDEVGFFSSQERGCKSGLAKPQVQQMRKD